MNSRLTIFISLFILANRQSINAMEQENTPIRRCLSYEAKYKNEFEPHADKYYYALLQEKEIRFAPQEISSDRFLLAPRNSPDLPASHLPFQDQPPSPRNNNCSKSFLKIASIATTTWITAEAINQYKKVSSQEWKNLSKVQRAKLIFLRTSHAMISRPKQLYHVMKRTCYL